MSTKKSLGDRLKELRREQKITQDDLASELGIAKSTVSAWERGIQMPEYGTLKKLTELFVVPMGYLLGESDDPGLRKVYSDGTITGFVQEYRDETDIDYYVDLLKHLSPNMQRVVKATIKSAYEVEHLNM